MSPTPHREDLREFLAHFDDDVQEIRTSLPQVIPGDGEASLVEAAEQAFASQQPPQPERDRHLWWVQTCAEKALKSLAEGRHVSLDTLARLGLAMDMTVADGFGAQFRLRPLVQVLDVQRGFEPTLALTDVAAAFNAIGCDGARLVALAAAGAGLGQHWPKEAVVPFVEGNPDELEALLRHHDDWLRAGALRLLDRAGVHAPALQDVVFSVGLKGYADVRERARQAMATAPGLRERLEVALRASDGPTREAAAGWLAELRDADAVPALEAAFARERAEGARLGILAALEALGRPLSDYLSRDDLAAQASKAMRKPVPESLAWLDFERLPSVRWSDGDEVPREVLLHLVVQQVRTKSVEPSPMLRRWTELWNADDRQRLGEHLLSGWIAADLVLPTREQAIEKMRAQGWVGNVPQGWTPGDSGDYLDSAYRWIRRTPLGSEIASKGVLGVVGACRTRGIAPRVKRYLTDWYGQRAAQCRALVTMLGWVDDPAATQLMLQVGSRFRTKSIQQEAQAQAEALAARLGWSAEELADRTVPTGGFDEDGILPLPFGERAFAAHLEPGLVVEVRNPDGDVVKALPEPRADDDAALAAESKKALAAARKEVRDVGKAQPARLLDTMAAQRGIAADVWRAYVLEHILMRQFATRLVWEWELDGRRQAFLPEDEDTLVGLDGAEVALPGGAAVRVAHRLTIGDEASAAWQGVLKQRGIAPLLDQFPSRVWPLTEAERVSVSVPATDVLVTGTALRNALTKAGWVRGQTGDGGRVCEWVRQWPGAGLESYISFDWLFVADPDTETRLEGLSFRRRGGAQPVGLVDVPPVLFSLAREDLERVRAAGRREV